MESWKEREQREGVDWNLYYGFNKAIAKMISDECTSVLDLGAGGMLLKKFLKTSMQYFPVDYVTRCKETIVCDFLKNEFPQKKADAVIVSGSLEYIKDVEWFLQQATFYAQREIIIRYADTDNFPDINFRRSKYWISDISFRDLIKMVQGKGFILTEYNTINKTQPLLKFEKQTSNNLCNYALCTGCSCCANICPVNAIKMKTDNDGFLKPVLSEEQCTHCNICVKKCPSLNVKNDNSKEPLSYACMANDAIREKSSSGGAFTLLAEKILDEHGVVFGAVWREDFSVHHIGINNIKQLSLLHKSKYLQSDTEYTYQDVKKLLDNNIPVLYTGCPCQIAGLKSYLGKSNKLLLTVDMLCSHVPSPKIFRRYLDENYGLNNVKSFTFRDKSNGWNPTLQKIELNDGRVIFKDWNEDYLQKGFHPCLFMNDTCNKCFWCTLPREGDITIGDFWGIDQYNNLLNDGRGTSAVLINTEKGQKFFEKIKKDLIKCVQTPINIYPPGQLSGGKCKHPEQGRFLDLLEKYSFNKSVKYALERYYDICLVSLWSNKNYGAAITYFSLYKVLTELGYEVLLLERPYDALWKPSSNIGTFEKSPYPSYAVMAPTLCKADMRGWAENCETVMIGSDQLFNSYLYHQFGEIVTLDWVPSNKRKIAYAASWGSNKIYGSEKERIQMTHFMQKFDAFSVREKSAIDLVQKEYNIKVDNVLDPVFLCDIKYINGLANKAENKIGHKKYLYAYILDPNDKKANFLHKCKGNFNTDIVVTSDGEYSPEKIGSLWNEKTEVNVSEELWLAYIKNCKFVITDSFHGMCMAIIFKKNFIAICNNGRGAARFESILSILGLMDRLVYDLDNIDKKTMLYKPIDYSAVYEILNREKERSFIWLKNALKKPVDSRQISDYDILQEENYLLSKQIKELDQFARNLEYRTQTLEKNTSILNQNMQEFVNQLVFMENLSGMGLLRKLEPILKPIRTIKRRIFK
ncbi:polysaccharide pyruvyl transferase family protein [Pectinatus cerevisiiphilus]|uniref:Coenzyme F420-reducing hydrogenase beta subunit n=1 Tax=Pectinatus cerevisiiphilus TaxID=86956 RepID=A0A4R3K224_9FIRM|nr:polysaccharide pyruvyl transferase family protein [Pectinatus cerevisiiphilus]TCS76027.1 coenzyme F420-reducing hydrogenase beta subunit [Pectinatus cerevisiiphilus]